MALAMMKVLESVTGVDILGTKKDETKKEEEPEVEDESGDPWARWKDLEGKVLEKGGVIILDGATGTEIERLAGDQSMNSLGWSCSANFTYPEVVQDVHESYLNAGAHIITANTYCTNPNVMQGAGLGSISEKSTAAAVRIAKDARKTFLRGKNVKPYPLVAGSLSCHPPKQTEGSGFDAGEWPDTLTETANITAHAKSLVDAGVDCIIVEMVWDMQHGEIAVKAACDTTLPVILSLSVPVPEEGSVMTAVKGQLASNIPIKLGGLGDTTLASSVQKLTEDRPNIVAVCVHHTPLSLMPHAITAVRSVWTGYLGAYPEHGTFEMPHWTYAHLDIDKFVSHVEALAENFKSRTAGQEEEEREERVAGKKLSDDLPAAPTKPTDVGVSTLPPPPDLGGKLPPLPVLEPPPVVGVLGSAVAPVLEPPPVMDSVAPVLEPLPEVVPAPVAPVMVPPEVVPAPVVPVLEPPPEVVTAAVAPVLKPPPEVVTAAVVPVLKPPPEVVTAAVAPVLKPPPEVVTAPVVPVMEPPPPKVLPSEAQVQAAVPPVPESSPAVFPTEYSSDILTKTPTDSVEGVGLTTRTPSPTPQEDVVSAFDALIQHTSSPRVSSSSGALAAFAAGQPLFTDSSPFRMDKPALNRPRSVYTPPVSADLPYPDYGSDDEALAALPGA